MERESWDNYFLRIAVGVGTRSTCNRGRQGAIIVKDRIIITTGYAGSAPGFPHCDDVGHLMETVTDQDGSISEHCIRTLHAEENAILQAAEIGVAIKGSMLYCTSIPCFRCAMKIIRVKIKKVIALGGYQKPERTKKLFMEAGIALHVIDETPGDYTNEIK
uniref:Putative CMP/dCMP deaminase zinc-binding n=1 Tax=viral metagenome TaxID=1070528 RepID=A0A6M3IZU5_9ZZZZ